MKPVLAHMSCTILLTVVGTAASSPIRMKSDDRVKTDSCDAVMPAKVAPCQR
jgi:hypothetical protein